MSCGGLPLFECDACLVRHDDVVSNLQKLYIFLMCAFLKIFVGIPLMVMPFRCSLSLACALIGLAGLHLFLSGLIGAGKWLGSFSERHLSDR